MKDIYANIPADAMHALAPIELQPEYLDQDSIQVLEKSCLGMGHELLSWGLTNNPYQVAAIHAESGRSYTYAFLDEQSSQLAKSLIVNGLTVGSRVGLRSKNTPEAIVAICGIWKAGGVVVPIPYSAGVKEIEYFINDTGLETILLDELEMLSQEDRNSLSVANVKLFEFCRSVMSGTASDIVPLNGSIVVDELPAINVNQLAIVWHTGGTTGQPKGCYHTHKRIFLAGKSFCKSAGVLPGERWAASAPIGHALGFIHHTIYTIMHGAVAVFIEEYTNPENILRSLDFCKVEVFTGMMLTWAKLDRLITDHREGRFPKSLRHGFAMWQTASAEDVRKRWMERGVTLNNNYGSTSFGTWVIVPRRENPGPPGCLGIAAEGYQVECVEISNGAVKKLPANTIGRLAVKGVSGLTYWNRQEIQARDIVDGWTLCDDLIKVDDDGFIHYLGRSDFMISSAGHKIAPVEVEAVISRFHSIKEVAVVPAPCATRYEQVVAFIVVDAVDSEKQFVEKLDAYVRSQLVSYKVPKIYRVVQELPKDSVGKLRTKAIREWAVELVT